MAYSGAYGKRTEETEEIPMMAGPEKTQPKGQEPRRGFDLGGILKKIEAAGMETDDLLMALILFLMYRESGDTDLLILLGVMLLT